MFLLYAMSSTYLSLKNNKVSKHSLVTGMFLINLNSECLENSQTISTKSMPDIFLNSNTNITTRQKETVFRNSDIERLKEHTNVLKRTHKSGIYRNDFTTSCHRFRIVPKINIESSSEDSLGAVEGLFSDSVADVDHLSVVNERDLGLSQQLRVLSQRRLSVPVVR